VVPLSVDEVTLNGLGRDLELELVELEPLEPFVFVPSEFESSGAQSGGFSRRISVAMYLWAKKTM